MLDIDQTRGAVANATAPGLGTALGALLSAFAVRWLPEPTRLIYVVLAGVLMVQALGVALLPETSPKASGAWRSLVPQLALPAQTRRALLAEPYRVLIPVLTTRRAAGLLRVGAPLVPHPPLPPQPRRALLAAAPVLFAVWALAGFYGSLGPSLIDHLTGSASVIDAGLGLGILAGVASITTYVLHETPASSVMLIGTNALVVGVAAVLFSLWAGSSLGFFAGTVVAGVGFGAGFQGGIRLVAPLARPDERAGVLSVLYTVSYLGLGIPAVGAGLAVVKGGGLVATSYEYGAAVIVLAAFAAINLTRRGSHNRSSTEQASIIASGIDE